MFQFRRFPSYTYLIQYRIPCGGFPHSEISGSLLICSSPKLIAAYHVLHRLLLPRHSPCALYSLTSSESASVSFRFRLTPKTSLHCAVPPLKSKPACAGLLICSQSIDSPIGSLLVELCRLMFLEVFFSKNCIFTLSVLKLKLRKNFLYCCLLIIAS